MEKFGRNIHHVKMLLAMTLSACAGGTQGATSGVATSGDASSGSMTAASTGLGGTNSGSMSSESTSAGSTSTGSTGSGGTNSTATSSPTTAPTSVGSTSTGATSGMVTMGASEGSTSTSGSICGDGVVDGDEECDDGNDDNEDGCSNLCSCSGAWVLVGDEIIGEALDDDFGVSCAVNSDGNTIIVGASWNDGIPGFDSGHSRIYKLQGGNWVQIGEDLEGEGEDDRSGTSVSMSGDGSMIAVGAPFNDGSGSKSGHARVYDLQGGNWTQIGADVDGADAWDESGRSVAISADGGTLVVGSPDGINGDKLSHARIFTRQGDAWVQLGDSIFGLEEYDGTGFSVATSVDGGVVIVGSPFRDFWSNGEARIFRFQAGAWVQVGSALDGEDDKDEFGRAVAMSADGSTVIIGAPHNDGVNGSWSGHARVFRLQAGAWVQVGSDIDGEAAGDDFGRSVSMSESGDTIIVGAPKNEEKIGHARAFTLQGDGWVQRGQDIDGYQLGEGAGRSVAVNGDGLTIVVGAPDVGAGRARVYRWCE